MPKRIRIDDKTLIKMVKDGKPQAQIMDKFGYKNSRQLKVAYANALMKVGEVPSLKAKAKPQAAPKAAPETIVVNRRGSLVIPRAIVAKMGYAVGSGFAVRKSATGVSLKKQD